MDKQYCPECGDMRYIQGKECMKCGFPSHYLSNGNEINELEIDPLFFVNSNENEESKNG